MSTMEIDFEKTRKRSKSSKKCRSLINWIVGFAISLLPILILPLIASDNVGYWDSILKNSDMFFVCVSLAVSVIVEVDLHQGNLWAILRGILLLDIVGSALLYMIVEYSSITEDPLKYSIDKITVLFLGFTLLIGIVSFIASMREGD